MLSIVVLERRFKPLDNSSLSEKKLSQSILIVNIILFRLIRRQRGCNHQREADPLDVVYLLVHDHFIFFEKRE